MEDPSAKHARRPRHKTKENKYEYRDVSTKSAKKRLSKNVIRKTPGATLTEDFHAPNVAAERLTLRSTGPGFLLKGKSSGSPEWRGLPDLTFSEMTFLKRKRKDENDKTGESHVKKKHRRPPGSEISAFFSRPEDQHHQATSLPKRSSIGSYVSWSMSPARCCPMPMRQRSSLVAQPVEKGARHEVVGDNMGVGWSACSDSALTDRLFKDITTDALLCGVNTFAHREKRYYSLEDLKMLAEPPTAESRRGPKALYGFDIMPKVDSTVTSPRSAGGEEVNSARRSPELLAHADNHHVRQNTECLEPEPLLAEDPTVVGPAKQRKAVLGAISPLPSDMDDFDRNLWRHWIGSSVRSETKLGLDDDTSSHGYSFSRPSPRVVSNYWARPIPGIDEDQQVGSGSFGTGYLHEVATKSNIPQQHPRSLKVTHHVVEDPLVGFSGFSRRQILY
ncbi:hypothetical protein A1O7_07443 [Cladophialophora yegresii CBS 114405]|uniref:Uncharacterized protein n=1 Tax=Cladophialophora yegresii CBS 114405 TaxID=1182544 RepID=W9WEZ8_9EURO|nr:uncharacterized protein A1O7_07443 [Cladophialophora yegresii CBS 114405]EXJ57099.1 hypothetical protein A1O7_07443 [Cladophialophora yegresii CBS 114405]